MRHLKLQLSIWTLAAWAQTPPTGGIQGTVTSDTGAPLPAAYVTYSRVRASAAEPILNGSVNSGNNGAFAISGVPAGTYRICVQLPGSDYLNSCEWQAGALPVATVAAGQTVTGVQLAVKKGVKVPIRIDDPQGLIADRESKKQSAYFLLAVRTASGIYQRAWLSSKDSKGHNYAITVAPATPVHLLLHSSDFQFSDDQAVSLPAAASVPLTATAGAVRALTFRITGIR